MEAHEQEQEQEQKQEQRLESMVNTEVEAELSSRLQHLSSQCQTWQPRLDPPSPLYVIRLRYLAWPRLLYCENFKVTRLLVISLIWFRILLLNTAHVTITAPTSTVTPAPTSTPALATSP